MTDTVQADAVVVGAGTSGCFFAWRLCQAGFRAVVLDKEPLEELGRRIDIFHMDEVRFDEFRLPSPPETSSWAITPLSVLQGNLWALLNDAYPLEKSEISHLYDETRFLSRLVEDLSDLALADAGELCLELQPMDLAQVIGYTVDNLALAAGVQEVSLSAQLPDDLAPARADPGRVAQVLRALLVNALRHTPPGGSVTVSASQKAETLEVAIVDTGEGIAAQDLPHVFERFWRADPARARSKTGADERLVGGTGLGLSVAQSLVKAQGGRIWVESTQGEGAAFRFTLPFVGNAF